MTRLAIGFDIGGTGMKGAVVDVDTGTLVTERLKQPTPEGARPKDVLAIAQQVVGQLDADHPDGIPIGVCFPAIVKGGKTLSAANVSKQWIGLDAEALFERELGRAIRFINDADAAGVGEAQYGAARGVPGVVLVTTLGTGIGSALLNDGILVPNTELGHIEIDGKDAERQASATARQRHDLSWEHWAVRLQRYYETLESLFSPDLFVVGGGVSKDSDKYLSKLSLTAPIVPAQNRNNAGIIGAAYLAVCKADSPA